MLSDSTSGHVRKGKTRETEHVNGCLTLEVRGYFGAVIKSTVTVITQKAHRTEH